ncbi:serpin-ZX-like [Pyrus ussuriensis x Pyrus communis]|uniref:Serpin-ZX-like n=1 Tax=Pyrus ussuriensis x Pyrus communis TaxID=2448454 RepID=A0A5N5GQ94_9ROSA|nr:serpin-ZX-like [Pyrus ussuriensis x Pyrus communis]
MTKQLFLTQGAKERNMVYSPLSIHIVPSLIAAGTKGHTEKELLSFLKSKSTADSTPLPLISSLWSLMTDLPEAGLVCPLEVDVQTNAEEVRIKVNLWAKKETRGLITEVLLFGSVNNITRLNFGNALYFKGVWDDQFNASKTKKYDLYCLNGKPSVKAPFMTNYHHQYVKAFDGFKVLKLLHQKGETEKWCFSMCLFLPDEKDGLPALVKRVCTEPGFLDHHLPNTRVRVGDFRIPKFKITSSFEASEVLKELGLVLPFEVDPYNGGNLTEMVDSPPDEVPFVSSIFHKSFIEVNENGKEAAAVTFSSKVVGSCRPCHRPKPIDFVVDHPFLFFYQKGND